MHRPNRSLMESRTVGHSDEQGPGRRPGHLNITSPAEVWAIVERSFPGTEIPQGTKQLIKHLLPD